MYTCICAYIHWYTRTHAAVACACLRGKRTSRILVRRWAPSDWLQSLAAKALSQGEQLIKQPCVPSDGAAEDQRCLKVASASASASLREGCEARARHGCEVNLR